MKGSSVEFRCSYNYPVGETVHKTAWSKGELKNGEWARVELLLLPAIDNRSEYLGDLQDDCSLAIHDLQENDTGYYYFRFDTNMLGWRSRKNVYLSVTGKAFFFFFYNKCCLFSIIFASFLIIILFDCCL